MVMGAVGGAGAGFVVYSNATKASDLVGNATTWNVNVGIVGASLSFDDDGHVTVSVGLSKGQGLDVSQYQTKTKMLSQGPSC
jgi:hypothetical protein